LHPRKYINRKKIEAAQLKLLIEDTSIKEIAFGLGFDNVSYFNRLFNKLTGESPGNIERECRRDCNTHTSHFQVSIGLSCK